MDFRTTHIAHLQRHCAAPGARHVDHACAIESETLNLTRKIILWKNKKFVERFRRNFRGSHVYFRVQRRLRFG